MALKLLYDQSPRKYGTGLGSNRQSQDQQSDMYLQSDTLSTALHGPAKVYVGPDVRKPSSRVCEQHRRRPACASAQSDQRLCYSPFGRYHI